MVANGNCEAYITTLIANHFGIGSQKVYVVNYNALVQKVLYL